MSTILPCLLMVIVQSTLAYSHGFDSNVDLRENPAGTIGPDSDSMSPYGPRAIHSRTTYALSALDLVRPSYLASPPYPNTTSSDPMRSSSSNNASSYHEKSSGLDVSASWMRNTFHATTPGSRRTSTNVLAPLIWPVPSIASPTLPPAGVPCVSLLGIPLAGSCPSVNDPSPLSVDAPGTEALLTSTSTRVPENPLKTLSDFTTAETCRTAYTITDYYVACTSIDPTDMSCVTTASVILNAGCGSRPFTATCNVTPCDSWCLSTSYADGQHSRRGLRSRHIHDRRSEDSANNYD